MYNLNRIRNRGDCTMSRKNILAGALIAAFLAPHCVFAQRGASTGGYSRQPTKAPEPVEEEKKESKRSKKAASKKNNSKKEDKEPQTLPVGSDKESIEAYLQRRLSDSKKLNRDQEQWGRGMAAAWGKFWTQMYEDRKSFEIRIARQRLNLFESLDSLDPAFHGQTISDFERLQGNIMKSFESQQQTKMRDYFSVLFSDLKSFQSEQEAARVRMGQEAMDAWSAQKESSKVKKKR